MLRVAALLLAAGRGRRFGSDKRQALLPDGRTLLQHALALLPLVCDRVVLVIGAQDEEAVFRERFPGVSVLRSRRSGDGMGYSLADATDALDGFDACLVSLADKPFVRRDTLLRVRQALEDQPLVVPTCGGDWGHPVGFGRSYFGQLAQLRGDRGARALIEQERGRACFVEVDDPGILADVDTPEQLGYWCARLGPL